MVDWPRLPRQAPESLVVRMSGSVLELGVGNTLPVGLFSALFLIGLFPFVATFALWVVFNMTGLALMDEGWAFVVMGNLLAIAALGLTLTVPYLAYRFDFGGRAGDGLTIFNRKTRQVHQRVSKRDSKGQWNWDDLHPYIETRNSVSRVNQALTLVEMDRNLQKCESLVTVEVQGMSKEPLFHTYAFIKEFMDNGVSNLPPFRLTALPEPGWYVHMPPWFLWLPRSLAKAVWAFIFLLFTWPIIVWSRLLRRVLPYSRWPTAFEAELQAANADATPAEQAWLAANLQPPEPLPLVARIAFVAAVVVSAPVWWGIAQGYAEGLARFW